MSINWFAARTRIECVAALRGIDASDLLAMSNAELDEAPEVTAFAKRTGASLDWLILGKHTPFVEGREGGGEDKTRQEPFSKGYEKADALSRHTHAIFLTSLVHAAIHMSDAVEASPEMVNLLRETLEEVLEQSQKLVLALDMNAI